MKLAEAEKDRKVEESKIYHQIGKVASKIDEIKFICSETKTQADQTSGKMTKVQDDFIEMQNMMHTSKTELLSNLNKFNSDSIRSIEQMRATVSSAEQLSYMNRAKLDLHEE